MMEPRLHLAVRDLAASVSESPGAGGALRVHSLQRLSFHRVNSVGIATRLRAGGPSNRGFDSRKRQRPVIAILLLSNRLKRLGRESDHSLPYSIEMNAWSYTSTLLIQVHGILLN
jgi:hypothetical protein